MGEITKQQLKNAFHTYAKATGMENCSSGLLRAMCGNGLRKALEEFSTDEITRLRSERDAAVAIVRQVEWAGEVAFFDHDTQSAPTCPMCDARQARGHAPDCPISKLLAEHPAPTPADKDPANEVEETRSPNRPK